MVLENLAAANQPMNGQEAQFKELFRRAHEINKTLDQFEAQATHLREISVNSAIAAGHVGAESAALNEVASQIGKISRTVAEAVREAHAATGLLGNHILSCIVESARRQKLLEAHSLTAEKHNRAVLEVVVDNCTRTISGQVAQARKVAIRLQPALTRMEQAIHRTSSIVVSLKISSGLTDEEEDTFFLPIAESLETMAEECARRAEDLYRLSTHVNEILVKIEPGLRATRGRNAA